MSTFTVDVPVRFNHCDPAWLVFYPRYFEMVSQVVEDWFEQALGCDYEDLHGRRGLGVPTVRIAAHIPAPTRLGDVLGFRLEVARLGRASFDLRIEAWCEGECRLEIDQSLVFATLDGPRSMPIPGDLRPRMARYLRAALP